MKNKSELSFKGFSLVELMVTLIIVSLLIAALSPAITKKLTSKEITVGSLGGGSNQGECPSSVVCKNKYFINSECKCQECSDVNCKTCENDICTECDDGFMLENGICVSRACAESLDEYGNSGAPSAKCCESVGAKFLSKEQTGTTDLCMMKYNAGDDHFTYQLGGKTKIYHPDYYKLGICMMKAGDEYCRNGTMCCWKGTTAVATDYYANYPAADRTVCRYDAAVKICQNWALGSKKGAWRLLTESESNALAAIMKTETADNPIISRFMDADGLQLCNGNTTSAGKATNICYLKQACMGASNESYCCPSLNFITTTNKALRIIEGNIKAADNEAGFAGSVRCVSANLNKKVSTTDDEPTDTNSVEPRNQADCPDGTLFISKKYLGTDAPSNICMMKYNAGDDRYKYNGKFYHPDYAKLGICMMKAGGDYCRNGSMCCWKGTTAVATDYYANYSAAERTVCGYDAAVKICENWAFGNTKPGHWRLLTPDESAGLTAALKTDGNALVSEGHSAYFSRYLDSQGLQLCNGSTTSAGKATNICYLKQACMGASNESYCCPSLNFITTTNKALRVYGSDILSATNDADYAGSVRCVSDNIREVIPDSDEEEYQTNEPRSQADCDKYKALFIDKKYLNGAARNICMTKYNFADEDAVAKGKPYLGTNTAEDYANVGITYVATSGDSCTTGLCCWHGTTANATDYYTNYSAANRTVCTYNAASILCSNWAPDTVSKGKWRLLAEAESTGLAAALKADGDALVSEGHSAYFSRYLDEKGLQLCNQSSSNAGKATNICTHNAKCYGASGSVCYPAYNFIGTTNKALTLLEHQILPTNGIGSYGGSVRCVSDTVDTSN